MQEWRSHVAELLSEVLAQESSPNLSAGNSYTRCMRHSCASEEAQFRCLDCVGQMILCKDCIVESHQNSPFHHVQVGIVYADSR